jgi:xanthine phosphoribosyltransferase
LKLLEERILKDGIVLPGNILRVDSFLNHQMDIGLFNELGREFASIFKDCAVNKVLTIEASGIGVACITAQYFSCPVLFAKKHRTSNIPGEVYKSSAVSYTHETTYDIAVSKRFLNSADKVLVIDDFLAHGNAVLALADIVRQSGAQLVGVGIVIEKAFQEGGALLREQGIRVESLARIASMVEGSVQFCE